MSNKYKKTKITTFIVIKYDYNLLNNIYKYKILIKIKLILY